MKYIKIAIITILMSNNISAQSPIIDIEDLPFRDYVENAYYKDINNFMNPFAGTWLYTNGNTSFKIILEKKVMQDVGSIYTDYIKGEYQYIENGVEKANTLSNANIFNVGIYGDNLVKNTSKPICNDCLPSQRRLRVVLHDRVNDRSASVTLKFTSVNGVPALEAFIWGNGKSYNVDENPPNPISIPLGTFTFIQQ